MDLTKEQRDALPADDFAVPGKRALPMHDGVHVRMAWQMVDKASGLTDAERKTARERILTKAKALGLDTTDWHTIKAMSVELSLEAMSLAMPTVNDHPNRHPFAGVLTRLDQPSDKAPGGSGGRRVVMTTASAEAALPSLLGMAVDFTAAFDGHDSQAKIGVITAASIVGNAIHIEGFFYAADFPEEVQRIQAAKSALGWSYEIQRVRIADPSADPLVIESFVFTGAAVLQKSKAAYHSTSLTASADKDSIMDEELKALLAGMAAGVTALTKTVGELAGSIKAQADDKAAADKAAAEKLASDQAIAAAAAADAAKGETVTKLQASLDDVTKQLTTMKADAEKARIDAAAAPARKTLSPEITTLLSRVGLKASADGTDKLEVLEIDKAFQAAGITGHRSMAAKNALHRAGLIAN